MPGFYSTHIFARLMDWVMKRALFQEQRQLLLAPLHGTVLEIGFGTGLNLPHYPKSVSWLSAIEPETMLPHTVAQRSVEAPMPVEVIHGTAEKLPFEESRFDFAVSTWTLCTIPNVHAALTEIRRVLKPDGMLLFLEHGRGDDPLIVKWQDFLNPIQRVVACGCNLNRPIATLIEEAGMKINALERFEMQGLPRTAAQMYRGTACPAKN